MVTKTATVNTEQIQRIVNQAAKRNTVRILRSNGTQTLMTSFKDCWMEVAGMIGSDRNNVIFHGEPCNEVILHFILHVEYISLQPFIAMTRTIFLIQ